MPYDSVNFYVFKCKLLWELLYKKLRRLFLFSEKVADKMKVYIKTNKSKKYFQKILKTSTTVKIELGAGNKPGTDGWTTIDITEKCNIYWDLRNGLPFPDESIDGIYSCHFFEHLNYKNAQSLLKECYRVLKPNGFFSISVPNAKIYIDAYNSGESLEENLFLRYKPAIYSGSMMDLINYIAYMDDQHKYLFDEEDLVDVLKTTGFLNAKLREFDPKLDVEERKPQSIFAVLINRQIELYDIKK